jgi:predicted O-methyltransferase YrrM
MTLDVTYGNVTAEEAERLAQAAGRTDDVPHEAGSTEPWVSRLVADFIVARGARTVLETGTFKGATTVWIVDALAKLGGGQLFICEIDKERLAATTFRLVPFVERDNYLVGVSVTNLDVLRWLATTTNRFDLAFVDDCHEKLHVRRELELLYPKMNPGGLILLHDVFGVCDLQSVVAQFGGYSIDLPRLGPAGGLGIIQCR